MQCPKCSHIQEDGHMECMRCGIIFNKWREKQAAMNPPPRGQAMAATAPVGAMMGNRSGVAISRPRRGKKIGFFSVIPCPHCGQNTKAHSDGGNANNVATEYFGFAGAMVAFAFSAKYHCGDCGLIDSSEIPDSHRNLIFLRKMSIVISAVGIFSFLVWVLIKLEGL